MEEKCQIFTAKELLRNVNSIGMRILWMKIYFQMNIWGWWKKKWDVEMSNGKFKVEISDGKFSRNIHSISLI